MKKIGPRKSPRKTAEAIEILEMLADDMAYEFKNQASAEFTLYPETLEALRHILSMHRPCIVELGGELK